MNKTGISGLIFLYFMVNIESAHPRHGNIQKGHVYLIRMFPENGKRFFPILGRMNTITEGCKVFGGYLPQGFFVFADEDSLRASQGLVQDLLFL